MEERVRELNRQLQDKMRQRVVLSAKGNKSASDSNHIAVPSSHNTPTIQNRVHSKVEIRTPEDVMINQDYYSDSGVATSSFTVSSKRNSPENNGQV